MEWDRAAPFCCLGGVSANVLCGCFITERIILQGNSVNGTEVNSPFLLTLNLSLPRLTHSHQITEHRGKPKQISHQAALVNG